MARDGAAADRRARTRQRHPATSADVGSLGPFAKLHRPAGGLQELQAALSRRSRRRRSLSRMRWRTDRGAPVQPDVQDLHGTARGHRQYGIFAARDRAGHFRELRQRDRYAARETAVRHRANRQIISQRNHARQFYFSHARVRTNGDGVLRQARCGGGAALVRLLGRRALQLVRSLRYRERPATAAAARAGRAIALLARHHGRRISLPFRLGRA